MTETAAPEVKSPSVPVVTQVTVGSIRDKLGLGLPQVNPWFNTLIFADTGVGKTHFCGTANTDPETGPLLLIDCNEGYSTVLKFKMPDGTKPDIRQARGVEDLIKIHNDIFKYNKGWYKTIAIDDATELNDTDMRGIMIMAKEASKTPETFNIDVPSPREWGIGRNHLRKIIRGYKDLPLNLIVTAYEYTVEKEGKPDKVMASFAPAKLRTEIPGFMDVVGWYRFGDAGHNKRILQVQGTNRVQAKNRFDLGGALNDITFPDLYQMVQEYKRIHTNEEGDNT